jgi:hypothetical protein
MARPAQLAHLAEQQVCAASHVHIGAHKYPLWLPGQRPDLPPRARCWDACGADRLQATHGCADLACEFIDNPRCGFDQFRARRGSGHQPDLTVLLIGCDDSLNRP